MFLSPIYPPCQPGVRTQKLCTIPKFFFKNYPPLANLAEEFNGLVSKRVSRKIGPFHFFKYE